MRDLKKELEESFGPESTEFDLVGFPIGNDSRLVEILNDHWSDEELDRMEDIQMTDDELVVLPTFIRKLKNLDALNVAFNKISVVTKDEIQSTCLTDLDLRENPIERFEIEPEILSELDSLSFSKHKLTEFPPSIAELKNTMRIELKQGRIEHVKFKKGSLERLRNLDLSFNRIGDLDKSNIDALKSLERLNLSTNGLFGLPEELGELNRLGHLTADSNQLEFLPQSIGKLKSLSFLDLQSNLLSEIPATISGCEKLGLLRLQNNLLSSLPDTIGDLKELGLIYLRSNQFTDIPESLSRLKDLGELDLSKNPIGSISSWVYKYSGLHLYLRDCPIDLKQIEDSLQNIKKAKNVTLYLSGCPVEQEQDQLPKIPGLTFSFEPMN